ncbi:hypothetical protein I551_8983 [Mycobacterium ulcerans str. Harvey]|uniref:Uncharacterized protein n=1 Tax=Mycobacterium ulcerans str. Harvey TaxID=1299332 RepID=A0ABN0R9A6_MYCUL|nr:hypothetical protein I551_8983 [Mycobacterium ulcerans str. Harvey]
MHPLLDTATELAENRDGCSPAGSATHPTMAKRHAVESAVLFQAPDLSS